MNVPTVTRSATTLSYTVKSVTPTTTTDGTGKQVKADEILVPFKHLFEAKLPLPKGGRTFELNTTLVIYSSAEQGKIVRIQDRPDENLPDNAFLNVGPPISDATLTNPGSHGH